MKRKLTAVLLSCSLLLAVAGLSGCAGAPTTTSAVPSGPSGALVASESEGSSGSAPAGRLEQILEKGEIIIATEGTWAPWTYHDESDTLVGFDVEVAQKIAEKLGVTATFVEGEWDGLLAGLEVGRYDIMANGVEITAEREEKYDFSEPYAYIRTALITRGDDTAIQSFEDLSGKTTANTLSSTYTALAESYGAIPTGVDDLNQTIELLLAGRVDATLNAEVTFYDYMSAHPDANLKVAALTEEASLVAIPMPKGDEAATLREAINTAISELRAEGVLSELSNKYFGSDITNE
ncbi:MAG: transporter substrate-binding domain-containing protein [Oscillospiraceae bacterium]|nr:transporter substrate-binding domain-containing protein [Oscillospiraceae bacterium]